jgi:hypothetical protein
MSTFSITCIDALSYTPSITALRKTLSTLNGKISKVYWFSDIDIPEDVGCETHWIKIPRFKKYTNEYNYITLKLVPHISVEDYNLIIHPDGFAVNAEAWDDEYLQYDYIGARWQDGLVGNGGFCLRSRKLYDAMLDINIPYHTDQFPEDIRNNSLFYAFDTQGEKVVPEDVIICKIFRNLFETNYGLNFPSGEIADKFSIEHNLRSPWLGKSLGFHGKHGVSDYYGVKI